MADAIDRADDGIAALDHAVVLVVTLFAVLSSVVVTAAAAGTADTPAPTTDAGSQTVQTRA